MSFFYIEKICSGGQTGADRAGLDFAIAHDITHGGFCPRGRRAEDGVIPSKYKLTETTSAAYLQRTRLNVQSNDATIIFCETWTPGSQLTRNLCTRMHKPFIRINPFDPKLKSVIDLCAFLNNEDRYRTINVAGSRIPSIYMRTLELLDLSYGVWRMLK